MNTLEVLKHLNIHKISVLKLNKTHHAYLKIHPQLDLVSVFIIIKIIIL